MSFLTSLEDYGAPFGATAGSATATTANGSTAAPEDLHHHPHSNPHAGFSINDEIFLNVADFGHAPPQQPAQQPHSASPTAITPELHGSSPIITTNSSLTALGAAAAAATHADGNYDYMDKRSHSNSFSLPIDQLNLLTLRHNSSSSILDAATAAAVGAAVNVGSAGSGAVAGPDAGPGAAAAVVPPILPSNSSSLSHSPSPSVIPSEAFSSPAVYNSSLLMKGSMEERTINPRQLFNDHSHAKPLNSSYSSPSLTTLFKSEIQLQSQHMQQPHKRAPQQPAAAAAAAASAGGDFPKQSGLLGASSPAYTSANNQNTQDSQNPQNYPSADSASSGGIQHPNGASSATPRFDFIMNDECFNAIHYWLNNSHFNDATENDSTAEIIGNPTGIMKYQRRRNSIQISSAVSSDTKAAATATAISKKKRRKSCNTFDAAAKNSITEGLNLVRSSGNANGNGNGSGPGGFDRKDEKIRYKSQLASIKQHSDMHKENEGHNGGAQVDSDGQLYSGQSQEPSKDVSVLKSHNQDLKSKSKGKLSSGSPRKYNTKSSSSDSIDDEKFEQQHSLSQNLPQLSSQGQVGNDYHSNGVSPHQLHGNSDSNLNSLQYNSNGSFHPSSSSYATSPQSTTYSQFSSQQSNDAMDTEAISMSPIKSPTLLSSQQFGDQSAVSQVSFSPRQLSPQKQPFSLQSQSQPQQSDSHAEQSTNNKLHNSSTATAKSPNKQTKPSHSEEDDDSDEEKPFPCANCTKQFKRSEHLKRHIRSVHSNIRPFHCKYCEKKFSRSDNLAQHLKTHYKTLPNGTTTIILGNPNLFNRGGRRSKGT